MVKKLGTVGLIAVAALAVAQGVVLMGARGQGAAVSEDHRRAEFRMDVHKLTSVPPRLAGNFSATVNGPEMRQVHIELRELRGLQVSGTNRNICEFGGRAVLTVRTPQGLQHKPGALHVRVADNASSPGANTPDLIRILFTPDGSTETYRFAGAVRHGDIKVYIRTP
jgi:hypothetical protein